jgi:PAS domain S-box-containing protein
MPKSESPSSAGDTQMTQRCTILEQSHSLLQYALQLVLKRQQSHNPQEMLLCLIKAFQHRLPSAQISLYFFDGERIHRITSTESAEIITKTEEPQVQLTFTSLLPVQQNVEATGGIEYLWPIVDAGIAVAVLKLSGSGLIQHEIELLPELLKHLAPVFQQAINAIGEQPSKTQEIESRTGTVDKADYARVIQELSQERSRLANILRATNVGTWEWNVPTGEVICNETWAQMLGYNLAELEPVSLQTRERLTHPDDLPKAYEGINRHFAGESDHYLSESRLRHKDGHWVWIEDRGELLTRGPVGEPLMMYGTHTDITSRKQAEWQLESNANFLRKIIQTSLDGFWMLDARGRLVDVNEAYCAMTGYTREELLQLSIPDLDQDEDPEITAARIQKIRETGSDFFERIHTRRDGSKINMEIAVRWIDTEGGQMVCFCRDTTKRKLAEQALRDSEANFRTFFETIQDMVFVCDSNGWILSSNDMMKKKLGYSGAELTGMHFHELHPRQLLPR